MDRTAARLRHPLTLTVSLAVAGLVLAAGAVRPAAAAEPRIELSDQPIDLPALAAAPAPVAAGGVEAVSATATLPSNDLWLVPFVVDADNPSGTTTLLGIRMQDAESPDPAVEVDFLDSQLQLFHETVVELDEKEVQTFNLRDQPGLPAGGVQRGLVRVRSVDGDLISVDYFVVTPSEDFATGGKAIEFFTETCVLWSSRVLVGGPFTGGTRLQVLIDGPQGTNMGDDPTLAGNVFDEDGDFVNSFAIHTDQHVLELSAAQLIAPASLFGVIEIGIFSTGLAGIVRTEIGAEGRYSVGMPAVCLGSEPVAM